MSLVLRQVPIDGADASGLVEQVQQEYERRYGGRDTAATPPAEFAPPQGTFLVAYREGAAVGCGGIRLVDVGPGPLTAEVKRMYVVPTARGAGVARRLLAALEQAAREAGAVAVRLETGTRQPEAIGLYASCGYLPVPVFGVHAGSPHSRCFGRSFMTAPPASWVDAGGAGADGADGAGGRD